MGDSGAGWWFGADRRWRKGAPPRGWRQSADGSWHPPSDGEDPDVPAAQHMAAAAAVADGPGAVGYRDSSFWTRLAGPVSIAVVTLCALVATASVAGIATVQTGGTGDPADDVASLDPAPDRPAPSGPAGTTAGPTSTSTSSPSTGSSSTTTSTPTSTSTSTTTTEPPSTETTAPAPDASDPSDPFALCSESQLALLDRGNRPWSWIVARLDQDGDGILCN